MAAVRLNLNSADSTLVPGSQNENRSRKHQRNKKERNAIVHLSAARLRFHWLFAGQPLPDREHNGQRKPIMSELRAHQLGGTLGVDTATQSALRPLTTDPYNQ
jgi:hypothetical protein